MKPACPVMEAASGARDVEVTPGSTGPAPSASAAPAVACETLSLAVGATFHLDVADLESFSVTQKGVVDVIATSNAKTFEVTGRKSGSTRVTLARISGADRCVDVDVEAPRAHIAAVQ